jgi:hypothetical protein
MAGLTPRLNRRSPADHFGIPADQLIGDCRADHPDQVSFDDTHAVRINRKATDLPWKILAGDETFEFGVKPVGLVLIEPMGRVFDFESGHSRLGQQAVDVHFRVMALKVSKIGVKDLTVVDRRCPGWHPVGLLSGGSRPGCPMYPLATIGFKGFSMGAG